MSEPKPGIFIVSHRAFQAITKRIYDHFIEDYTVGYHFSDDIQVDYEADIEPHILASAFVIATITPEGLQINHATNHFKLMLSTAIEHRRAIVPLMFFDDSWETEAIQEYLPEPWQSLTQFDPIHLNFTHFNNTLEMIEERLLEIDTSSIDIQPPNEQFALSSIELDDIESALKAEGWYERGNRYYLDENYEEAKFHFSKAIDLNPKFVDAYNNRGIVYRKLSDSESALIDYERAIKFKRGALSIHLSNYATSLYETGSLRKAVSANRKSIEIDPQNSLAHNNLGLIYSDSNQNQKAIEAFSASIEINRDSHILFNNRAIVYEDMDLNEEAIADYSRAYELKSDKHEYLRKRAKLYYAMDKVEKALIDFKRLLELQADSVETYTYLSRLYLSIHQNETALNYANKAIELDPEYSPAYNLRSDLYILAEDYEKALNDLNKLKELVPDSPVNYLNSGIYFSLIDEHEKAIEEFNYAIQLHPPYALAYFHRGIAYSRKKRYRKALKDFDRAVELDEMNSDYHLHRGFVYIHLGNLDMARHEYYVALELDPHNKAAEKALESVQPISLKELPKKIKELLTYMWRQLMR